MSDCCLSIYPSIRLLISKSLYVSVCPPDISLSVFLHICCPSVCISIPCQALRLFTSLSLYVKDGQIWLGMSICLSRESVCHLSVHPFIYVSQSVRVSVCQAFISISTHSSVHQSIYLYPFSALCLYPSLSVCSAVYSPINSSVHQQVYL